MPARNRRCERDFVGELKGKSIRGETHVTANRKENNVDVFRGAFKVLTSLL
jgi:hypothetical protein